ncbi:MAG: helix-turn-helix domain-containing protein [Cellulosilyticaceae bacterium]
MNKALQFKDFAKNNRKYYIADLELQKNDHTYAHTHDFYEFFIVMKGEFEEHHNEDNLILEKRHVHVIKPQDSHYLVSTNNYDKNILRNIAIEKEYFEQCLDRVGVDNYETLFDSFKLDDVTYLNCKSKTDSILQLTGSEQTNHFIFKSIFSDILICGLVQKNNNYHIPKWLKTAYIEIGQNKNYVEGLDKFISISGKSQEHLTREFKKYYSITPSDYINNLRLQEVTNMLRTCDSKIIDIVYTCGFNNISYFNRLFKLRYGLSPREYRDMNKKIF